MSHADSLAAVIGTVITPTIPPPRPQSTLEIPGGGPINFIPTNREALWSVAGVPHARLVPLELPGVYTLRTEKGAMVLHPGGQARTFYLKGATDQFDQITVRISHVADEARYVLSSTSKQGPPSVQWSATLEGGYACLFVSLTIPAGLYRMNEPVASMTLNFGVLGRLTWLDRQGKEGLLGLEVGVLGASLIPQQDNGNAAFPRTLDTLMGLGPRVDIGQGAAVGVHLWGAYEFRNEYWYLPSGAATSDPQHKATHWSLIFGPSLSIGNVGINL